MSEQHLQSINAKQSAIVVLLSLICKNQFDPPTLSDAEKKDMHAAIDKIVENALVFDRDYSETA